MQGARTVGLLLAAAGLLLGSGRMAQGRRAPEVPLERRLYSSASGEFSLEVDPSARYGSGPADYRALRSGREVWKKRFPFTLRNVVVAEDGTAVGYGYSHGERGFGTSDQRSGRPGDFRIVILDPAGGLRLDHSTPRKLSRYVHPLAVGLFLDEDHDRFTARVIEEGVNGGVERWRPFRLSTGEALPTIEPHAQMESIEPGRFVLDARAVRKTPLALVHWWRHGKGGAGAQFTLIGHDGRPVWSFELPGDYMIPGNEEAQDERQRWIRKHGAILAVDRPGEFEIRHVAPGLRVRYSAELAGGNWQVTELHRLPYVPPAAPRPETAAVPTRKLRFLGSVTLRAPGDRVPEVRAVGSFAVDGQGRFAVLREEDSGPPTFMLVSPEGRVLRKVRLGALPLRDGYSWRSFTWVGGDRFLLVQSPGERAGNSAAGWVDFARGTATPVRGFQAPWVKRVAGRADGSFVALASTHAKGTITDSVHSYDAQGREQWRNEQDYHSKAPGALFSPMDVMVTRSGKVAVLDGIVNLVKVYDRSGRHLKTIDLEKSWKRAPNYPSGLAADREDGFVVEDFNGPFPVVRMRVDGSVRAELSPKFRDGRRFEGAQMAVSPDGRLWTCDGYSLLGLDAGGRVERVIGSAPSTDRLAEIRLLHVSRAGTIYATSARTGATHVFNSQGRHLHVCRPGPTDLDGAHRLAVSEQGHVYLGTDDAGRYLHFGPDGRKLGFAGEGVTRYGEWHFGPKGALRWVVSYDGIRVVQPGQPVRAIERAPDGGWLKSIGASAVAPDGSLALLTEGLGKTRQVQLFAPDGTGLRTFAPAPGLGEPYQLAYDKDGLVLGSENEIAAYDRTGRPLWKCAPSVGVKGVLWRPFLTDRGELWLYDGGMVLYRYAWPARATTN